MEHLISIVMIAYNMEKYIAEAIESVIKQTHKKIEIIIVDDGSTDHTLSICQDYAIKDMRIKVIHQENKGTTSARKAGADEAIGDYIGFIDADDIIEPDMYELLLRNALKYNADISHCGYTMIRLNGKRIDYYGTGKIVLQNHEQGLIDLIEGKFVEPTACTKLYKRSLFENLEYYTDVSINEDLMLNYSLFSKSKQSVYQDVCKYHYIKHEGSMSRTLSITQFADPIKVKCRIYQKSENESINVQMIAKSMLASQYINNCFSIKENGYKDYNPVYKENRKHIKEMYHLCELSVNDKLKAKIIIYAPWMCKVAHKFYKIITKKRRLKK